MMLWLKYPFFFFLCSNLSFFLFWFFSIMSFYFFWEKNKPHLFPAVAYTLHVYGQKYWTKWSTSTEWTDGVGATFFASTVQQLSRSREHFSVLECVCWIFARASRRAVGDPPPTPTPPLCKLYILGMRETQREEISKDRLVAPAPPLNSMSSVKWPNLSWLGAWLPWLPVASGTEKTWTQRLRGVAWCFCLHIFICIIALQVYRHISLRN